MEGKPKLVLLVKTLCKWNPEGNSKCVDPPTYDEVWEYWI